MLTLLFKACSHLLNLHQSSVFTPQSSLLSLHSSVFTPQSSLLSLHSSVFTPQSSLLSLHSSVFTGSRYWVVSPDAHCDMAGPPSQAQIIQSHQQRFHQLIYHVLFRTRHEHQIRQFGRHEADVDYEP
ncbi:uncharacterized protein K460DRAFT_129847 [Cucurbitaria berberidis CBS 394.84]|uniref:Uncharacterized protein n=1 Tax=Cucurbitaria berberidis CBS 394.84 TaxID=1168544 RepID=A0A9P4GKH8_9PLEO|nr:uncharacterized protein K460DRAFT_129847 [Cucurbitaria berberidis CBS 394.84]KAF1846760.1 hypothetical protein K460DRAFT_129847 [Cucurbitaria berberidis CBS 394.84]